MALLKPSEGSFADVPDKQSPIGVGLKTFKVLSAIVEPAKAETLQKEPDAKNLVVESEVETDCPDKGRKTKRWISTKMSTEIKRLALSCGIPREQIDTEGVDTDLLVGRSYKAMVTPNVYTDKQGVKRESTQISEYLIPGDQGYSS